jgi:hypothetical protein
MSNISNQPLQLGQGMFVSSATQTHPLGTRGVMQDGRVFRYVLAGAVDLIPGTCIQSPAVFAGHQQQAVSTTAPISPTAIGGTAISITCASCVATNYYQEGYVMIASGAGAGFMYQLDSHAAVSTGATGTFNFYNPNDANTYVTAIHATSTITLCPNPYRGVVVVPATTATGIVVGVATYVITTAQYGWIQTWGMCAVQASGAFAMGQMLNGIAATSGQTLFLSSPAVTACAIVGQFIGRAYQTGIAVTWTAVYLQIAS